MNVDDISIKELQHIVWEQLGIRPPRNATAQQLHEILQYRIHERDLPRNPINNMRDTIMSFIRAHKGRLSIPCSGNCYEHSDGRVIGCYIELEEDINESEEEHK